MEKNKKKSIIAIVAVVAAVAVMLVAWLVLAPKASKGSKSITVVVNHLSGDAKTFKYKTDAEFLRAALEEKNLIAGTESEYGLWVQTVDGETANDDNQEWWGYDVNGEMGMYGVDTQPVADGDLYEFTLNVGY